MLAAAASIDTHDRNRKKRKRYKENKKARSIASSLVAQITAQELTPAAISLRRWGAEMGS
jgi:hypothetical protein